LVHAVLSLHGAPSPLFFAITATFHAAPLAALTLAAVDVVDVAVTAIPLLGEWPSTIDRAVIAMISVGVYVVSGGPLPARAS
jgi:hypothetical protein